MQVGSSLQAGLSGVQSGVQAFNKAAQQISTHSISPQAQLNKSATPSMAELSVNLMQAEQQVAASENVVKASDEMLGTLLNTTA